MRHTVAKVHHGMKGLEMKCSVSENQKRSSKPPMSAHEDFKREESGKNAKEHGTAKNGLRHNWRTVAATKTEQLVKHKGASNEVWHTVSV